jgi:DNA-binding CsgD family transcriptional regulator
VASLSKRQSQVLALVARGLTTKEIAGDLGISDATVKWHVGRALSKLGASSRAEAVAIAVRSGELEQLTDEGGRS